jgi:hypothetical protein
MIRASHLLFVVTAMFFSLSASAMILPPNDLYKQDSKLRSAAMSQKDFDYIINNIIAIWAPRAKAHGGAVLTAEHLWDDSTVNAYANQDGSDWQVHFYGGLARRPEMTPDGFALVICHELGHHFGGYYFYDDDTGKWAAAEGEADYFATDVCGREVLQAAFMNKYNKNLAPGATPKKQCDQAWSDPAAQKVCYRMSNASQALANLLAAAGEEGTTPSFDTPDTTQVDATNTDHPASQCRLDTYFQASLCTKQFDTSVIPGKDEVNGGTNATTSEQEAMKYTCFTSQGYKVGARPRCWFKPQL